jgi:segregation and condensation protein A
MQVKQEYQVKLSLFEGPLDLLLYLVNRAEVDITQIQVSQIAQQYLEYLDLMRELNIDIAAEYLYMASTLIRLKARELLPPSEQEPLEGEEGIYNREQLIAQLLEYKKFKEAAHSLRHFEADQIGCFTRGSAEPLTPLSAPDDGLAAGAVTVFDLITAFKRVLDRAAVEGAGEHVIGHDTVRLDDRIEYVLGMVSTDREIPFADLFAGDPRRIVLVVTFMAILELVKMQEILFRQETQFGSILVRRRVRKEPEGPAQAPRQTGRESSPDSAREAGTAEPSLQ